MIWSLVLIDLTIGHKHNLNSTYPIVLLGCFSVMGHVLDSSTTSTTISPVSAADVVVVVVVVVATPGNAAHNKNNNNIVVVNVKLLKIVTWYPRE